MIHLSKVLGCDILNCNTLHSIFHPKIEENFVPVNVENEISPSLQEFKWIKISGWNLIVKSSNKKKKKTKKAETISRFPSKVQRCPRLSNGGRGREQVISFFSAGWALVVRFRGIKESRSEPHYTGPRGRVICLASPVRAWSESRRICGQGRAYGGFPVSVPANRLHKPRRVVFIRRWKIWLMYRLPVISRRLMDVGTRGQTTDLQTDFGSVCPLRSCFFFSLRFSAITDIVDHVLGETVGCKRSLFVVEELRVTCVVKYISC